ncbi:MAG: ISAs1 family transposase [Candidatus Saccharibacteria bacterium]|nr:ISAs1 family transposase [Candidatus Saccharibacteria bacterium]
MAKINHFILEYKECLATSGITPSTKPPKVVLRRFVRLFKRVDDSRIDSMIDYPLVEILLITFLAVLANASTWTEISYFGESKKRWLKKFIPLKNGVPTHDTFRRVFSLIDSASLQKATVDFLMENMASIRRCLGLPLDGYRLLCVDGKEQRGTGRKYGTSEAVRNLQTLHVYDATHSVCLYSCPIAAKTNEIPVAQHALRGLDLKGCIVTFDALHTQKETIAVIAEQKGDYVGGLKGNQNGLLEAVTSCFTEKKKEAILQKGVDYYETSEKSHNQVERRCYYRVTARCGKDEWAKLKSFICFEKHTQDIVTGKETHECRFYISSLSDIRLIAEAIRGHWSVENNLHWHLDYSFSEDAQTTMDKQAFQNLSLINKLVLSLCKMAQPVMTGSVRSIRLRFSWNLEDQLAILLNTFDDSSIQKCLESAIIR